MLARSLLLVLTLLLGAATGRAETLTIFAAASLTDALQEALELYEERSGRKVVASFAASSALARQIEHGAPAAIYFSANPQWLDYLAERGLIAMDSRQYLLGNALVLIAPAESDCQAMQIEDDFSIMLECLGQDRLALADPDHVPAGQYAREALQNLGLWEKLSARIAPASDARAALALVARGEAPLGIVYATDARSSESIRILGRLPLASYQPIRYPIAVVAEFDGAAARDLLSFLASAEVRNIFRSYGFL